MKSIFPLTLAILGTWTCTVPSQSIHQVQSHKYRHTPDPKTNLVSVSTGLDMFMENNLDLIKGKSIGLVTNMSGIDKNGIPNYKRLMEYDDVNLKIIFSPEHGLFGEAAAGEKIEYDGYIKTFPKVISLYGQNKKPTQEMLKELDFIIYDIQDIGARFYTYISTLGLVIEAAAESNLQVIILDRPNPITGLHIEGPVLDMKHQSFVGFYPIPIRYGLTVGEIAKMMVGEKWTPFQSQLLVIPMEGWTRDTWFDETTLPWVNPSPNIPNLETATLYPGLCLLEATNISEGRGTQYPFKWIGAPWIDGQLLAGELNKNKSPGVIFKPIHFIPKDIPGMAINPKFENQSCYGVEIILQNRHNFHSINTGVTLIKTIKRLYPEKFTILEGRMNRLWGQDNFPNYKEIGPLKYNDKIQPYLLYD